METVARAVDKVAEKVEHAVVGNVVVVVVVVEDEDEEVFAQKYHQAHVQEDTGI